MQSSELKGHLLAHHRDAAIALFHGRNLIELVPAFCSLCRLVRLSPGEAVEASFLEGGTVQRGVRHHLRAVIDGLGGIRPRLAQQELVVHLRDSLIQGDAEESLSALAHAHYLRHLVGEHVDDLDALQAAEHEEVAAVVEHHGADRQRLQ